MSLAKRSFEIFASVALAIVLAPIVYLLCSPLLDERAKRHAEEMCGSIRIGQPTTTLHELARTSDTELLEWSPDNEGGVRYQSWFRGFTCEMYAKKGSVQARFVEDNRF
jgi:hypothetical protein